MKMYRKWGRRILAAVLVAFIVVDAETIVLAEEVRDAVSEAYSEYEQKQQYEEERNTVTEQVIPEQAEGALEEASEQNGTKVLASDGDSVSESGPKSDGVVSLRLPDIKPLADEKEAELESLYGEPVEISEHEKVYQVDAQHYITYLTSEANTYVAENGEEKEIDLTLVPTDADTGGQCEIPTEEQIRDDFLDIVSFGELFGAAFVSLFGCTFRFK